MADINTVEKLAAPLLNTNNPLEKQVSGSHYKDKFKMQPIELITICKWDFIQGNIAKYLLRAPYKNGQEDIDKAIHYCELGDNLTYQKTPEEVIDNKAVIRHFIKINNLDKEWEIIFILINAADYHFLVQHISDNERTWSFLKKYLQNNLHKSE